MEKADRGFKESDLKDPHNGYVQIQLGCLNINRRAASPLPGMNITCSEGPPWIYRFLRKMQKSEKK